jgi:hypothetical protein
VNFSVFLEFSAESYAQFSESLFCCFSEQHPSANVNFSSMFQSHLDLPLNTKKVYHNLTELLPKIGNFGGHRF